MGEQPVVTLLTDFGLSDSYVAEMKAAMLAVERGLCLVDVAHQLELGDVQAAQYLLERFWHRFPRGTVHLVVVDPGVGTSRRAIAATNHGHGFVAPDNGILSPILEGAEVVQLPIPDGAAPTFHGRDVFAPAAARLAAGAPLAELGRPFTGWHRFPFPDPKRENHVTCGTVVHVDRFGTLVTNIRGHELGSGVEIQVGESRIGPLRRTFADVEPGALVAFIGSNNTVEVAVRDGSATAELGTGLGAPVRAVPARRYTCC